MEINKNEPLVVSYDSKQRVFFVWLNIVIEDGSVELKIDISRNSIADLYKIPSEECTIDILLGHATEWFKENFNSKELPPPLLQHYNKRPLKVGRDEVISYRLRDTGFPGDFNIEFKEFKV